MLDKYARILPQFPVEPAVVRNADGRVIRNRVYVDLKAIEGTNMDKQPGHLKQLTARRRPRRIVWAIYQGAMIKINNDLQEIIQD